MWTALRPVWISHCVESRMLCDPRGGPKSVPLLPETRSTSVDVLQLQSTAAHRKDHKPPRGSGRFLRSRRAMTQWLWSALALLLSLQRAHGRTEERPSCKPVMVSFCEGVGYNTSMHPNGVQGYNLQQIGQVVVTGCSPDVAAFMCRMVVPECIAGQDGHAQPCRSSCERVKRACEPALTDRWLSWPENIRCDNLAETNCVNVSMMWRPVRCCYSPKRQCFVFFFPCRCDFSVFSS